MKLPIKEKSQRWVLFNKKLHDHGYKPSTSLNLLLNMFLLLLLTSFTSSKEILPNSDSSTCTEANKSCMEYSEKNEAALLSNQNGDFDSNHYLTEEDGVEEFDSDDSEENDEDEYDEDYEYDEDEGEDDEDEYNEDEDDDEEYEYDEDEGDDEEYEYYEEEEEESEPCVDNHDLCSFWAKAGECVANPNSMLVSCQKSCGICVDEGEKCKDDNDDCSFWAEEGECNVNPNYMLQNCQKSCQVCIDDSQLCIDRQDLCSEWAQQGKCDTEPRYMHHRCKKSCGICFNDTAVDLGVWQTILPENNETSLEIIYLSREYLFQDILPNQTFAKIHKQCMNFKRDCVNWALLGECEENEDYMRKNCPLACCSCEMLDISFRCPLDPNEKEALEPGDLNRLFERILTDEKYEQYKPTVLSRPYPPLEEEEEEEPSYKIGPWVVTFESFLTEEECERLIDLGSDQGYSRSLGVGKLRPDGTHEDVTSETRTSENAWCYKECYDDLMTKNVLKRIEDVTGVPETNQEYLQMLRYEKGQLYKSHHDYIPTDVDKPAGPRILTFYLYLNDVEKGGGTEFTDLGLTVMPKRGKAVLWPSVLDEDPMKIEDMTNHGALAVEEGVKYGANAWIHLRDFKTPYENYCH